jgi:hypothetical protein
MPDLDFPQHRNDLLRRNASVPLHRPQANGLKMAGFANGLGISSREQASPFSEFVYQYRISSSGWPTNVYSRSN